MADHYRPSSSYSGDGIHRFFPDPPGSLRLKYVDRLWKVKSIIAQLQSITCHGRSRGFTLDKCITKHVECHNRLTILELYGYRSLDPSLQVSYLTTSIQAEHLKVVTAQILANGNMRNNFSAASNAYRDYERILMAGNDN